jgi:ribosomal protein L11 methyltransferase
VPGRAFGTGEHATTQLCAEQLERHVVPGSHWLDLGCGTGLLSVVASSCGAGQVLALDIDPEAVRVARAVLTDNRPSARVVLALGSLDAAATTVWDGVVANLSAEFLLGAARHLAARLKIGGWLIGSGFLVDDLPALLDAFGRAGLSEHQRLERGTWAALVLRRRGARE